MKRWRKPISYLLIAAMLISMLAAMYLGTSVKEEDTLASAAVLNGEAIEYPAADRTKAVGTAENPMVILEVVPYEAYAEFGYLIDGQEPVNLATLNSKAEANPSGAEAKFLAYLTERGYLETKVGGDASGQPLLFSNQIPGETEFLWVESGSTELRAGHYERVADGTGQYKLDITYGTGDAVYYSMTGSEYAKDPSKFNSAYQYSGITKDDYYVAFTYVDSVPAGVQAYDAVPVYSQNHRVNEGGTDKFKYTFPSLANDVNRYYYKDGIKYCYRSGYNEWYAGNISEYTVNESPTKVDYAVFFYPSSTGNYIVDHSHEQSLISLFGNYEPNVTQNLPQIRTMVYRPVTTEAGIQDARFRPKPAGTTNNAGYNWKWVWEEPDKQPDGADDNLDTYAGAGYVADYTTGLDIIGHKFYDCKTAPIFKATAVGVENTNLFLRESVGLKYRRVNGEIRTDLLDTESYQFTGWYEAGSETEFDFTKPVLRDVDLYAGWKETPNCSVEFDADAGGAVVTDLPLAQYNIAIGTKAKEPAVTPKRAGYQFTGWYNGEALFDFNTEITQDVVLMAKWVRVSFDKNTADSVSGMPGELSQIGMSVPVRTGYIFAGWYLDAAAATVFRQENLPATDFTLYADWYRLEHCDFTGVENLPRSLTDIPTMIPVREGYVFDGWYCDAAFTVKYQPETGDSDRKIYAKWSALDLNTEPRFHLVFRSIDIPGALHTETEMIRTGQQVYDNAGVSDVRDVPVYMPETRTGFTFGGWYYDSGCTVPIIPNSPIRPEYLPGGGGSMFVYAKWNKNAVTQADIRFDRNVPAGVSLSDITDFPVDIPGVQMNGTSNIYGNPVEEPDKPELTGYLFTGWYLDSSCTVEYRFLTPINEDMLVSGSLHLYAGWVRDSRSFTVTFHENKPVSAMSTNMVTNLPTAINLPAGGLVPLSSVTSPVLKGNVPVKVDDFHVQVITTTPDNLNKDDNKLLIERANLIIISPKSHFEFFDAGTGKSAVTLWEENINPVLFSGKNYNSPYMSSRRNATFVNFDLSWRTTRLLFEKIVMSENPAALIYDTEAYRGVLETENGSRKTNVQVVKKKPNGSEAILTADGSNNNVYKLFLMLNQMNPKTFYHAFLSPGYIGETGSYVSPEDNVSLNGREDAKTYWTTDTFLPYVALTESDFTGESPNSEVWAQWGIRKNLDDLLDEIAVVDGSCFFYDSDKFCLTDDYGKSYGSYVPYQEFTADLYRYFNPEAADIELTQASLCSVARTGLYLINRSADFGTGYEKDINILEIQPSNNFMSKLYWFWYVRRFIKDYAGLVSVEQQATPKFISQIEDLNSEYYMIYVGAFKSGIDEYKKVRLETNQTIEKKEKIWKNAGESVTLQVNQNILEQNTVTKDCEAGPLTITVAQELQECYVQKSRNETVTISEPQYLYVKKVTTDGVATYYYGDEQHQYVNAGSEVVLSNTQSVRVPVYTRLIPPGSYYLQMAQPVQAIVTSEHAKTAGTSLTLNVGQYIETKVSETKNAYNDYYSYTHTGARITGKARLAGALGDYDTVNEYYLSGNDITQAKMEDILDFAKAGYPVVYSEELMYYDFDGNLKINTTEVDTASNLYALMNTMKNEASTTYHGSFFYENSVDSTLLEGALTRTNCELTITKWPKLYSEGAAEEDAYINGGVANRDNKVMTIEFQITDADPNSRYHLRLYVDTNADGRFDENTERLDNLEIYEVNLGRKTFISQDTLLKSNQLYSVNRNLDGYIGVIPWKLEVIKSGTEEDNLIRDNAMGMSAVMPADVSEKEEIRILQVVPKNVTVTLPNTAEMNALNGLSGINTIDDVKNRNFDSILGGIHTNEGYYSNTEANRKSAAKFWYYIRNLQDFNIKITRMSVDELNGHADPETYFKQFNMLILGFSDCYQDINAERARNAIDQFINEGKSVLFTHDTTSFDNRKNWGRGKANDYYTDIGWGYDINKYFRDIVGMDRYGITLLYPPNGMNAVDINTVLEYGRDAVYKTGTSQEITNIPMVSVTQKSGSGLPNMRYQEQGYSDTFLNCWRQSGSEEDNGANSDTVKAAKVNSGQLTEYPYQIPDVIDVALTHGQYYQLDLEAEDIVVWYTLDKSNRGSFYDNSQYDARNNYYIYNRGNITYTGVGHSNGFDGTSLTDDEVKLFVNTMIASYMASAQKPEIVIENKDKLVVNKDAEGSGKEYYLYVDYDSTMPNKYLGDDVSESGGEYYKRVFFSVRDNSVLQNKKIFMEFYRPSESGTEVDIGLPPGEEKPKAEEMPMAIYYQSDNSLVETDAVLGRQRLYAGTIYYVDVPLSGMNGKNTLDLLFRVIINHGRDSGKYKYGGQEVTLLRRGLIKLD